MRGERISIPDGPLKSEIDLDSYPVWRYHTDFSQTRGGKMKATFKSAWGYQGDNMNLPVADVDAAVPFYTRVMGFREESRIDEPHRSVILERDGIRIGLVENGGDPTQDGCAFRLDSVEGAWNEFSSNGLEKELSEFSTEEHDGAIFKVFYVVAPDGLCYWFGEKID